MMNLELLESAQKKAKEKLQTDVECQYQIQKVWLKNSEDQVSKLH